MINSLVSENYLTHCTENRGIDRNRAECSTAWSQHYRVIIGACAATRTKARRELYLNRKFDLARNAYVCCSGPSTGRLAIEVVRSDYIHVLLLHETASVVFISGDLLHLLSMWIRSVVVMSLSTAPFDPAKLKSEHTMQESALEVTLRSL